MYMGKSDYDFSNADKEVNVFSAISQIAMTMIIPLSLDIKSLDIFKKLLFSS